MSRMTRYPQCSSCINAELDPFQCESCDHGSNWEGAGEEPDDDTWEDISLDDLRGLIRGPNFD